MQEKERGNGVLYYSLKIITIIFKEVSRTTISPSTRDSKTVTHPESLRDPSQEKVKLELNFSVRV